MAKTAKLNRQALIVELEALIAQGSALAAREVEDEFGLADALVSRLEWVQAATEKLRQLPRNAVSIFADFSRAGGAGKLVVLDSIAAEAAHMRGLMASQIAVLDQAVTKLKNSRTKPLNG